MVEREDFNQFIDIVELIMGVVVNCDDKQDYIAKILDLDDHT